MKPVCPTDLSDLYQQRRVLPFVGAGASMSFSWDKSGSSINAPSWKDLVDEAIRQLGFPDPSTEPDLLRMRGTDLQILEYYLLKKGNHDRLKTWLVLKLDAQKEALKKSPIHKALAKLIKCNIYYTTNFDDFIEQSIRDAGRQVKAVASVRDIDPEAECEVVKFHGDLNNLDEMVLSESHYERRLRLDKAVDYRLKSDALNRAILFLGYSFRDWNVSYLFRLINDTFNPLSDSPHGTRGFIVVPDPSDFERRLFKERNIEVIPINSLNMTEDTAAILEEMIK